MTIEKLTVPETLWYDDKNGKRLPPVHPAGGMPLGAKYQIHRDVGIEERTLGIVTQKDVDACPHKETKPTGGWVDGVEGRQCLQCHGTQCKHVEDEWSERWDAGNSYTVMTFTRGWDDELVTKMVRSGEYTAREAVLISAVACERCWNVLLYRYSNLEFVEGETDDGYPVGSDMELLCGTSCELCDEVTLLCSDDAVACRGDHDFDEADVPGNEGDPPLYVCKTCGCYGKEIDDLAMKRHLDAGGEELPRVVSETIYNYKLRGVPKKKYTNCTAEAIDEVFGEKDEE